MLAARKRLDFQPLHLPDGCTWGTLGLSWERSVSPSIVEFLPLLKYAYSLKPICGAKLVTVYLVLKGRAEFLVKIFLFLGDHKTSIVSRKPCKLSVGTLIKHRK